MKYYRIAKRKIYNVSPCVDIWLDNNLFTNYEKALQWLKDFREQQIKIGKEKNCIGIEKEWYFNNKDELVDNCWDYEWNYKIELFEMPQYNIL